MFEIFFLTTSLKFLPSANFTQTLMGLLTIGNSQLGSSLSNLYKVLDNQHLKPRIQKRPSTFMLMDKVSTSIWFLLFLKTSYSGLKAWIKDFAVDNCFSRSLIKSWFFLMTSSFCRITWRNSSSVFCCKGVKETFLLLLDLKNLVVVRYSSFYLSSAFIWDPMTTSPLKIACEIFTLESDWLAVFLDDYRWHLN